MDSRLPSNPLLTAVQRGSDTRRLTELTAPGAPDPDSRSTARPRGRCPGARTATRTDPPRASTRSRPAATRRPPTTRTPRARHALPHATPPLATRPAPRTEAPDTAGGQTGRPNDGSPSFCPRQFPLSVTYTLPAQSTATL